jgi:hypothetical protein
MGRPCLIPNFSAYSEVGASYLDARLALHLVPRTELVSLASPSFHYDYKDRMAHERQGKELPEKVCVARYASASASSPVRLTLAPPPVPAWLVADLPARLHQRLRLSARASLAFASACPARA